MHFISCWYSFKWERPFTPGSQNQRGIGNGLARAAGYRARLFSFSLKEVSNNSFLTLFRDCVEYQHIHITRTEKSLGQKHSIILL